MLIGGVVYYQGDRVGISGGGDFIQQLTNAMRVNIAVVDHGNQIMGFRMDRAQHVKPFPPRRGGHKQAAP